MAEKQVHTTHHELESEGGVYIVQKGLPDSEIERSSSHGSIGLKTAKDGQTVLIPQPSDDPQDPLNWSWMKKHAVLASLLPGCFLTDWVITWGSTLFEAQAMEWQMTPPEVANSISGAIFMQGPGGLLAVPLVQRYGRLPVLFWSQFLTLIFTIGATYSQSYASFTACRTLQGFFGAPPQVIGLSIIHDMFFFHERARKINIWAFSFLIGPYLGPFISGFVIQSIDWRQTFGVLCGFYGFSVLLILLVGDETLYNREKGTKPVRTGIMERVKKLTGLAGVRDCSGNPGLWEVTKDLFGVMGRPYLLLPTLGFVTWITMFTIGIVSTITLLVKPPPRLFSDTAVALLFLAPMAGTVLAEFWGHWFNDFICRRYIRTHDGQYKPENRLVGVYVPWVIGIAGLVLFGQALQNDLHWVAIAFGWGMNCFSTLGTTTAISAYILDVFPQHAALASAWINAMRTVGGFCVVYFQVQWVHLSGPAVTFGAQAGIVAFFIVSIIATQFMGANWRAKFPVPATSRTL